MTGRRARQHLHDDMQARFYRLAQFFGCYFHQDMGVIHGSPEQALRAAIDDHSIEQRQQVRRELRAVMEEFPDPVELASVFNDGLGVCFYSPQRGWAREFAQMVDHELLESIKSHFEGDRVTEPPES